jgi:hypothetical protein
LSFRGRRAQVLVYPWVHPAALAAVVVVLLLAVAACWRPSKPRVREASRPVVQVVRIAGAPVPSLPAPRVPSGPRVWRAGTQPDALQVPEEGLVTSCRGSLRMTVLDRTLQNGAGGRPLGVAIEPYGLLIEDSRPWPVLARGTRTERAVQVGATVKFHVALHGPGIMRTLADTPFFDAPDEPRTRLVFGGEMIPHLERPGFAGQPSLRTILGDLARPDGTAKLARNQALLMWEFTSEFHSPAADFQDVVALVELVR